MQVFHVCVCVFVCMTMFECVCVCVCVCVYVCARMPLLQCHHSMQELSMAADVAGVIVGGVGSDLRSHSGGGGQRRLAETLPRRTALLSACNRHRRDYPLWFCRPLAACHGTRQDTSRPAIQPIPLITVRKKNGPRSSSAPRNQFRKHSFCPIS